MIKLHCVLFFFKKFFRNVLLGQSRLLYPGHEDDMTLIYSSQHTGDPLPTGKLFIAGSNFFCLKS